jgi:hypothetical protein
MSSQRAVLVVVALTVSLTGCHHHRDNSQQATGDPAAADFANALHNKVTADAMMVHLTKLQDIANANNGTRAVGTPGYEASVDYVVNTLRNSGFDVQTPEFSARVFHGDKPEVTVGGAAVEARPLDFSLGTPPDGVSGPLVTVPPANSAACSPADFDGLRVQGAVVLVDRGTCPFAQKEGAAVQRGAAAMIVVDNVDEQQMGGTLGADTDVKIPVLSVTKSTGLQLRAQPRPKRQGPQHHRADQDRVGHRRGDGGRAPGQRARGAGHQRQRFGSGRSPGNRGAAGEFAAGAQCGAVRLLGC